MDHDDVSNKYDHVPVEFQDVIETIDDVTEETTVTGTVNAKLLNVRAEANVEAEVLGVIKENSEVMIELEESTDEFYSICTESGLYGFCMKEFIGIKD